MLEMSEVGETEIAPCDINVCCWGEKNPVAEKAVHDVELVSRLIGYTAIAVFFLMFGSILIELFQRATGWGDVLIVALNGFFCLIGTGIVVALLEMFILKPVKAIKYARALSAIESRMPILQPNQGKQTQWKYPFPGAMSLNSIQDTLTVQSNNTSYRMLTLQQSNIVGAKVERKQTLYTETKQSGSAIFMFASSIGYATGRRSKSKTHVEEEAFLEIAYDTGDKIPRIFGVPFGSNRRAAEEWALAIQRFCVS